MSSSATSVLAVVLAALGAICFGLAAVRQHGAVRSAFGLTDDAAGLTVSARATSGTSAVGRVGSGFRRRLALAVRLVRQPAWRLGAGQAGLGGLLHMTALTLAPITLVQPVGVLAVPVTVVRSALLRRQRPSVTQVVGSVLSVLGVAALTLVLLVPAAQAAILPTWTALAGTVGAVVAAAAALGVALRRAPSLASCVGRAVLAASLFGTGSVLVRILGQVVAAGLAQHVPLLLTALGALALVLPLGIWAMQSAYLDGAPQVVICCLTLVDPVTAVLGGRYLLGDSAAVTGPTLLAALGCAFAAALGIVFLARDYPTEASASDMDGPRDGDGRNGPDDSVHRDAGGQQDADGLMTAVAS